MHLAAVLSSFEKKILLSHWLICVYAVSPPPRRIMPFSEQTIQFKSCSFRDLHANDGHVTATNTCAYKKSVTTKHRVSVLCSDRQLNLQIYRPDDRLCSERSCKSQAISVGIVTWLRAGQPEYQGSIPVRGTDFPLLCTTQTSSGVPPSLLFSA
jgi:hypothetical protein